MCLVSLGSSDLFSLFIITNRLRPRRARSDPSYRLRSIRRPRSVPDAYYNGNLRTFRGPSERVLSARPTSAVYTRVWEETPGGVQKTKIPEVDRSIPCSAHRTNGPIPCPEPWTRFSVRNDWNTYGYELRPMYGHVFQTVGRSRSALTTPQSFR